MSNIYVRLAKTNIQNNRQLYLPYIISGIVTVMMFYLMVFINNNPGLEGIPGSTNLKTIMALGVGVVAIFAYIFIFYTNSFIIKRRKKEIGVYNIFRYGETPHCKSAWIGNSFCGCDRNRRRYSDRYRIFQTDPDATLPHVGISGKRVIFYCKSRNQGSNFDLWSVIFADTFI